MQNERIEIVRSGYPQVFAPQTREKLLENGYKIYLLEDKNLDELRSEGKISSKWYIHDIRFDFHYRRIERVGFEAAVHPKNPFDERPLAYFKGGSFFRKQLLQAQTHAETVRAKLGIDGIRSVLPEACEIAQVMLAVEEELGIRLAQDSLVKTHTTVSLDGVDYVLVGAHDHKGLRIQSNNHGGKGPGRVMPLILPGFHQAVKKEVMVNGG